MSGDRYGEDATAMMVQDHEPIKESEADRRHNKQIHRGDPRGMVAQEDLPALAGWTTPSRHVLGDRRLRDFDAEFQQLTMNSWSAPQRIGEAHLKNEAP